MSFRFDWLLDLEFYVFMVGLYIVYFGSVSVGLE